MQPTPTPTGSFYNDPGLMAAQQQSQQAGQAYSQAVRNSGTLPQMLEEALNKKFQTEQLSFFFDIEKGDEVGSENYYDFVFKKENDIPFVRTSDIVNFEIDTDPDYFIPKDIADEDRKSVV